MTDRTTLFLEKHGLSLADHPVKRRVVLTRTAIPAGTEVFRSPALATVTLDHACHYCLLRADDAGHPLTRCAACKRATYCGKACQLADWKGGHSHLCRVWKTRGNSTGGEWEKDEEMLIKVVSALSKEDDSMMRINADTFLTLQGCDGDLVGLSAAENWDRVVERVKQLKLPMHVNVTTEAITSYLARFRNNNFSVHDADLFVVGEGTFPLGALLNHSCHPNCSVLYEGRVQIVRTIRDVDAGEELLGTYVDGMASRAERQQLLWEKYQFECTCERCGGSDERQNCEYGGFQLVDRWLTPTSGSNALTPNEAADADRWLMPQCRPVRLLLESLYPVVCNPARGGRQTGHGDLQAFITSILGGLPPPTSPESEYRMAHDSLLRYLLTVPTPASLAYPLPSRPMFSHFSAALHRHLDTPTPSQAWLSLYALCVYLVSYERFHPMVGIQYVLTAKLCWNALLDSDRLTDESLEALKRLINNADTVVTKSHGRLGCFRDDLDELGKLVDAEVLKLHR
ncbi:SET and MYND domain-containing protein 3 [Gaertneriomyces sp. JEL0708]|nr:SET and MYND domain-containing protein 3 [Gaertneriomyces sp. JEL0708]